MTRHPASYRDPSGFIFSKEGIVYRQVNRSYAADYDQLMISGLYEALTKNRQLVSHREVNEAPASAEGWKILQPENIPTISYPYEWCFEQLQDAALHTLSVLRTALDHKMILKDATPFNIQFYRGRPVFIDTLSFEQYDKSQPWPAYRQFCESFLFPLYLQQYTKTETSKWLMAYPNGVPARVTARLLPLRSRFNFSTWLYVHLPASVKGKASGQKKTEFGKTKMLNLVTHLESVIGNMKPGSTQTAWSNYYDETIVGKEYLQAKENLFRQILNEIEFETVLDLGANDGYFSRIMAEKNKQVIATDADAACISRLYRYTRQRQIANILPLVVDITNPTPAIGFKNRERSSFHERIRCDLVVALAIIHHLAISHNIPLPLLAEYFHSIAPQLMIEFVPKHDPKVQQLLSTRKDIFDNYDVDAFENSFSEFFIIDKKEKITGTDRILYRMKRQ